MFRRSGRLKGLLVAALAMCLVAAIAGPGAAYDRPGAAELISLSSTGASGNAQSQWCGTSDTVSISGNGRYVTFTSAASNLDPADVNGDLTDVFVKDRKTGKTEIVSVMSDGTIPQIPHVLPLGNCISWGGRISDSGRYVAFATYLPLDAKDRNPGLDVYVRDLRRGTTEFASDRGLAVDKNPLDSGNWGFDLSGNGRYVAYYSANLGPGSLSLPPTADGLDCLLSDVVPTDTICAAGIYLRDLKKDETQYVSVASDGTPANHPSSHPSLSYSGRYVIFMSAANNLVDQHHQVRCPVASEFGYGGAPFCTDVYMHDMTTGKTELISSSVHGDPGSGDSQTRHNVGRAITSDGRYVLFGSAATDLVPNNSSVGTNGGADSIYVLDRDRGRTDRIDVSSAGEPFDNSFMEAISADGRYVVFSGSVKTNEDGVPDARCIAGCHTVTGVWTYDRKTGASEPVIADDNSTPSAWANELAIDRSGRYLAFENMREVAPDRSDSHREGTYWHETYFYDRGVELGVGSAGGPRLSVASAPAFARTGSLWIEDATSDAVTSQLKSAGDLLGARLTYRPALGDLFVDLELVSMPATPALAVITAGSVYGLRLAVDGRRYEIRSASTGLGPGGETTAAFALFSCSGDGVLCSKAADLRGGFGTTGERLTLSVPLEDLGIGDDAEISGIEAFSSLGTLLGGPTKIIDLAG